MKHTVAATILSMALAASPAFAPQVNDLDLEVRVGGAVYRGNA